MANESIKLGSHQPLVNLKSEINNESAELDESEWEFHSCTVPLDIPENRDKISDF